VVVTRAGASVAGEDVDPGAGAVAGFLRSVALELPGRTVLIDTVEDVDVTGLASGLFAAREPEAAVRAGRVVGPRHPGLRDCTPRVRAFWAWQVPAPAEQIGSSLSRWPAAAPISWRDELRASARVRGMLV
jgi:hypothetical protein